MIYTISGGLLVLAACGAAAYVIDRGFYNAVDALSYSLHQFAKRGREREHTEERRLQTEWIKELEG